MDLNCAELGQFYPGSAMPIGSAPTWMCRTSPRHGQRAPTRFWTSSPLPGRASSDSGMVANFSEYLSGELCAVFAELS